MEAEQLVLCTACGAHGTSRLANLAKACPASGPAAGKNGATYRKQASLAARSLHPSRKGVELRHVRPLPARAAAAPQQTDGVAQTVPALLGASAGPAATAGEPGLEEEAWFDPALADLGNAATAPMGQHTFEDEDVFDYAGDMGDPAYL